MEAGTGALGAILHYANGRFIAGCCFKHHDLDVPSMEATALLMGLKLVDGLKMHCIVVESDSREIV